MENRKKIYIAIILRIVLLIPIYFYAYYVSIVVLAKGGPIAWLCNIGGFIIAYGGVSMIKGAISILSRNDEKEMKDYVSTLKYTRRNQQVGAIDAIKDFKKYVWYTIFLIIFISSFAIILHFATLNPLYHNAERILNWSFTIFSLIGAIASFTPFGDKLKKWIRITPANQKQQVAKLKKEKII